MCCRSLDWQEPRLYNRIFAAFFFFALAFNNRTSFAIKFGMIKSFTNVLAQYHICSCNTAKDPGITQYSGIVLATVNNTIIYFLELVQLFSFVVCKYMPSSSFDPSSLISITFQRLRAFRGMSTPTCGWNRSFINCHCSGLLQISRSSTLWKHVSNAYFKVLHDLESNWIVDLERSKQY